MKPGYIGFAGTKWLKWTRFDPVRPRLFTRRSRVGPASERSFFSPQREGTAETKPGLRI